MSQKKHLVIRQAFGMGKNVEIDFTRDELLKICDPIIDRALAPIDTALEKAKLEKEDIDLIIMAGGSSQLPGVSEKLFQKLGKKPKIMPRNLMLAVSSGATLQQREIMSFPMDKKPVKRVGTSLGILVQDGGHRSIKLLLNHNEKLPATKRYTLPIDEDQREASLQLVTMKGNQNATERFLNTRVLKLEDDTAEITAEITMTENRVIQLKAWDPKHAERQVIIQANQNAMTEAQIKARRKLLGISEKNVIGSKKQPCIGIDLGTTTTELTFSERALGSPIKYLENPEAPARYAPYSFPSVVYFKEGEEKPEVANETAVNALTDASVSNRVFSNFKTENPRSFCKRIDNKDITIRDLSALMLAKVWETAQDHFSDLNLERAVVTVPAKFDSDRCQEIIEAAQMAGIKDVTLIDEPTAAFEYYRSQNDIDINKIQTVLVFDFGGGTTDVAILDLTDNSNAEDNHYKECLYNVVGIDGDPECGGKNVDTAIYDYLLKQIEAKYQKPLTALYQRQLRKMIEDVKVQLSADDEDDE